MSKPKLAKLESREKGGEYLLDDERILRYARKGEDLKLAIPRVINPDLLTLVHSIFGHPGIARTTLPVHVVGTTGRCWRRMYTSMFSCVAGGEGNERSVSEWS